MKYLLLSLSIFLPVAVSAQGLSTLFENFQGVINSLLVVSAGAALLFFVYALSQVIRKSGSEDAHEELRRIASWGLLALFILVSIWGIISFVRGNLELDGIENLSTMRDVLVTFVV
jgi:hypothetical protein